MASPLLALAILAGCSSGGHERQGDHHAHVAAHHPAPKPAGDGDEGFWAGFWSAFLAILLGGGGDDATCLD